MGIWGFPLFSMKSHVNGFRVLWIAVSLILIIKIDCVSDSGGPPREETYYSENKVYYFKVIPVENWGDKGYYIKYIFGKTNKKIFWEQKIDFPTDVHISNDGKYIVFIGNYVHNMSWEYEGEGIRFCNHDGKLIKFINSKYFPASYSVSTRNWYQMKGFSIDKDNKRYSVGRRGGEILSDNKTFSLFLKNGYILKFDLATGKLKSFTLDLKRLFSSEGLLMCLDSLPGLVMVLLFFINILFAVVAVIAFLIIRKFSHRKTICNFKKTKYLFILSGASIIIIWFSVNLKWLLLFLI